ncbi:hypothetical protein [Capnocytophaga sp.]|uniref:hypothetical protein n=1 Tax=Capnocytophaga sp. TaxID=44737 RepID=UPI0026DC1BDA|nr:hypothetical protein [Capnocytophaga sp.]MDO5105924.1 hypothetical protein [Capnocytophaga sp.]
MQKPYYYHLFVARIIEGKTREFDAYIFDEEHNNPLFFKELYINDYLPEDYGLEVLNPDFRYDFPLSELSFNSLVKSEDIPKISEFCIKQGVIPNSYVTLYRQGLKIDKSVSLSYPNLYYIGEYEMDTEALENEKEVYTHLF